MYLWSIQSRCFFLLGFVDFLGLAFRLLGLGSAVPDCVDLDLEFKGGLGSLEDLPFHTKQSGSKSLSKLRVLFASLSDGYISYPALILGSIGTKIFLYWSRFSIGHQDESETGARSMSSLFQVSSPNLL